MSATDYKEDLLVALPKGRYIDISKNILRALQIVFIPGIYSYKSSTYSLKLFLRKPKDIARLVMNDTFNVGLCSDEWIIEECLSTGTRDKSLAARCEIFPYKLDKIRISLLAPGKGSSRIEIEKFRCVATSYPNIANSFFSLIGSTPKLILVNGSAEALVCGICDGAVDCVETGATAKRHGLNEIACIHQQLGISFIVSQNSATKNKEALDAFLSAAKEIVMVTPNVVSYASRSTGCY